MYRNLRLSPRMLGGVITLRTAHIGERDGLVRSAGALARACREWILVPSPSTICAGNITASARFRDGPSLPLRRAGLAVFGVMFAMHVPADS
jgi:hypothetical protein